GRAVLRRLLRGPGAGAGRRAQVDLRIAGAAGFRGSPAPAGGLSQHDRRLPQEPARRAARRVTPLHRPRVGPQLRRMGVRTLTDPVLSGGNLLGTWSGTTENFMRIGHSLFALIAAFVGGWLSRHLYVKNRQAVQGSVNPLESTSDDSGG